MSSFEDVISGDTAPGEHAPRPVASLTDTGKRTPKLTKLENDLTMMFGTVGLMVGMAGRGYGDPDGIDGQIIIEHADHLAHTYVNLAAKNPKIERILTAMVEGGAWGEAITATLMIAIPIAANHGAPIPPQMVAMFRRSRPAESEPVAKPRATRSRRATTDDGSGTS